MQEPRNYYEILGVASTASAGEIKRAYRALARQFHPDLNPDNPAAAEKFQQIAQIYQVLSDPMARASYDRSISEPTSEAAPDSIPEPTVNRQESGWKKYYQRGIEAAQDGEYERAIAQYNRAIQLRPQIAEVYSKRGFARFKLGEHQAAFTDYTQALQFKPQLAEVYYYRGMTRFSLGYPQSAIEDYTQALQFKPDDAQVYYHRGMAYADLTETAAAAADLRRAAQLFNQQGDRASAQRVQAAARHLGTQGIWWNRVQKFAALPKSALEAMQTFLPSPMGGLLPAFARLDESTAIKTSLVFAIAFDLCFVLGISLLHQADGVFSRTSPVSLAILGLVPFLNLATVGGTTRLLSRRAGSFAGDLFIAGAALIPLGLMVLLMGIFALLGMGHNLVNTVLAAFAGSYAVLILYSGCNQISNFSETMAGVMVPILLLLSLAPFALI